MGILAFVLLVAQVAATVLGVVTDAAWFIETLTLRFVPALVATALAVGLAWHFVRRRQQIGRVLQWFVILTVTVSVATAGSATVTAWQKAQKARADASIQTKVEKYEPPNFTGDSLVSRTLTGQRLVGARFATSHLTDVDFDASDLSEADFRGATLVRVNLAGVNLCAADARGADLRGVQNINKVTDWNFFIYDKATRFPEGFNIEIAAGPIFYSGRGILYSCTGAPKLIKETR